MTRVRGNTFFNTFLYISFRKKNIKFWTEFGLFFLLKIPSYLYISSDFIEFLSLKSLFFLLRTILFRLFFQKNSYFSETSPHYSMQSVFFCIHGQHFCIETSTFLHRNINISTSKGGHKPFNTSCFQLSKYIINKHK